MIDLTYIIHSHVGYGIALARLIQSAQYIPKDRMMIILSGASDSYMYTHRGYLTLSTSDQSFDHDGIIAVVQKQLPLKTDHVLFLQDTMEIGWNTDYLARHVDPKIPATAAFGGQCNLVVYRVDYLLHHKNWIIQRRNLSKHESVQYEGMLWKMTSEHASFPNSTCEILGEDTPYSDVPRIKEYYPALDIIKWKANYGQNMHAMITRP